MLEQSSFSFPAPEEWRAIPGYDGQYEVSDLGRVRSWFNSNRQRPPGPHLLKPSLSRTGYHFVQLRTQNRPVHQLVLEAFVGARPPGMVTGHLNGKRTDNRPENLRWITPKENQAHRFIHGTIALGDQSWSHLHPDRLARGEGVYCAKLTEQGVRDIRRRYAAGGVTQDQLATEYRVSPSSIRSVIYWESWTHLPDDSIPRPVPPPVSSLTAEQVIDMRAAAAAGVRQVDLAARYGISTGSVCRIIHRQTWTNVDLSGARAAEAPGGNGT